MPCSDGGYRGHTHTVYQDTLETKRLVVELNNRRDELARYLCYTIGMIKDLDHFDKLPPEIIDFARKHHEADEQRVRHKMTEIARIAIEHYGSPDPDRMAKKFIDQAEAVHPVSDWHKKWFHETAEEIVKMIKET